MPSRKPRFKFKAPALNLSWLLPLALLVSILALWYQTINIPYWWDSAGYVITGTKNLVANGFWPLDIGAPGSGIAHPLFFMVVLGLFWRVLGETIFVSHLVNLIFTLIIFFYTYKLGQLLTEDKVKGSLIAFCSSICLLFTPLFLAQLGIIYLEIPATAFAVMAVYYYLRGKLGLYILGASLMILSKEVVAFVILAVVLTEIVKKLTTPKYSFLLLAKRVLLLLSPLLVLFAWFFYHYLVTGWWYIAPGQQRGLPLSFLLDQLLYVIRYMFFDQWRVLVTVGLIVSVWKITTDLKNFKSSFSKDGLYTKLTLLMLVTIGSVFTFGLTEFLHRYILVGLPFLYLLFFFGLAEIIMGKKPIRQVGIILFAVTLVLTFLLFKSWNPHRQISDWYFPPLEDSLEYKDVIDISKNVTTFLETKHPDSTIYTSFPTDYMLSEPYQGYVQKPLKVRRCSQYKAGDPIEFMVFHFFSPEQIACAKLTQDIKWDSALKFEKNGKFMILYVKKEATTPAILEIN